MGEYEFNSYTWTPTSSDVYAFDAEVFDIENMYALFLQGVKAIVPGFDCRDVTERYLAFMQDRIDGRG